MESGGVRIDNARTPDNARLVLESSLGIQLSHAIGVNPYAGSAQSLAKKAKISSPSVARIDVIWSLSLAQRPMSLSEARISIHDFVKAYEHFNDPVWDDEPPLPSVHYRDSENRRMMSRNLRVNNGRAAM